MHSSPFPPLAMSPPTLPFNANLIHEHYQQTLLVWAERTNNPLNAALAQQLIAFMNHPPGTTVPKLDLNLLGVDSFPPLPRLGMGPQCGTLILRNFNPEQTSAMDADSINEFLRGHETHTLALKECVMPTIQTGETLTSQSSRLVDTFRPLIENSPVTTFNVRPRLANNRLSPRDDLHIYTTLGQSGIEVSYTVHFQTPNPIRNIDSLTRLRIRAGNFRRTPAPAMTSHTAQETQSTTPSNRAVLATWAPQNQPIADCSQRRAPAPAITNHTAQETQSTTPSNRAVLATWAPQNQPIADCSQALSAFQQERYFDDFLTLTKRLTQPNRFAHRLGLTSLADTADILSLITTIQQDGDCRSKVFEMAQSSGADCEDNALTVFSDIQDYVAFRKLSEQMPADSLQLTAYAKRIAAKQFVDKEAAKHAPTRTDKLEWQLKLRALLNSSLDLPNPVNALYTGAVQIPDEEVANILLQVQTNLASKPRTAQLMIRQPGWHEHLSKLLSIAIDQCAADATTALERCDEKATATLEACKARQGQELEELKCTSNSMSIDEFTSKSQALALKHEEQLKHLELEYHVALAEIHNNRADAIDALCLEKTQTLLTALSSSQSDPYSYGTSRQQQAAPCSAGHSG